MTDDAFLAKLAADPADDTTRLVYADWLDEHGQADHAAYLRAAVEMVRLCGDGVPPAPAVESLVRLAEPLDAGWRTAAAGRFMVILFWYAQGDKFVTAELIHEVVGLGLNDSIRLCDTTPDRLADRVPFERAYRIADRMQRTGSAVVVVLPADGPLKCDGVTYQIHAHYWDGGLYSAGDPPTAGEVAFRDYIAAAVGVDPVSASDRIKGEWAVLRTGVPPDEVAGTIAGFRAVVPQDLSERGISISVVTMAETAAA